MTSSGDTWDTIKEQVHHLRVNLRKLKAANKLVRTNFILAPYSWIMSEVPVDPFGPGGDLGELPVYADSNSLQLKIPDVVPDDAKEWLIYVFVTVLGGGDDIEQRGFYEFASASGTPGTPYRRFMNVAFIPDTVMESDNLRIPANKDRTVDVILHYAGLKRPRKDGKLKKKPGAYGLNELMKKAREDKIEVVTRAYVLGYIK